MFALQGTEKNILDLAQTVFSFQTKIKIFQKDINSKTFCHFPNLKTTVNEIPEVMIEHQVKEYQDKLQDCGRSFNPDLAICRSLSHALRHL